MRWEDERWIKLYTRDTVDWHFLSFEAQGLFCLLLRKVDRAGILRLGRHGERGVAAAVGHPTRADSIALVLKELLADRCVVIEGDRLVIPSFVEAQEATTSPVSRQRAKRERDRDGAMAAAVTKRDEVSQNVTERHAEPVISHAPSRAVTTRVDESRGDGDGDGDGEVPPPAKPPPPPPDQSLPGEFADSVATIFREEKRAEYAWTSLDDNALRELDRKGDNAEILRRFRNMLRRQRFPQGSSLVDLNRHWNAYAQEEATGPPKDNRKAPIRAEDIPKSKFAKVGDVTNEF